MTSKAGLVVFAEDWGAHPSSTQHLAKYLARNRQVLWVNSLGLRRPRFNRKDLGRAGRKLAQIVAGQGARHRASEQPARPDLMEVMTPLAVSWPQSRLAFVANRALLRRQILARLGRMGIEQPIVWVSLPSALPVVGCLGERKVVYYCADDFGSLAGVDHAPILDMERRLVDRADLVMAASELLAAKFPSGRTIFLPHGVDLQRFGEPVVRAADMPNDGRPVAGFYGSLSDWIDIDLIASAAHQLPNWHFVLIGPVRTDVSALSALANIRLLGPRGHDELPGYVQHWNVSLIPFRNTQQIEACNPLKLREYLAAGRPIASVNFPALASYRDLVTLGEGAEGFTQAIVRAGQDGGRDELRRAAVSGESWAHRAARVERELDQL